MANWQNYSRYPRTLSTPELLNLHPEYVLDPDGAERDEEEQLQWEEMRREGLK